MAENLKVPDSHKIIPKAPEDLLDVGSESQAEIAPAVALPTKTEKAKTAIARKADSHLRRRNRRANRFQATLPFTCELEAGTRCQLQGFSTAMSVDGQWTLEEIEIRIAGKTGTTTRVSLHIEPDVAVASGPTMLTDLQKEANRAKSLKGADKPVDAPANTSGSPTPLSAQMGAPK
jgi:hypothetical protein